MGWRCSSFQFLLSILQYNRCNNEKSSLSCKKEVQSVEQKVYLSSWKFVGSEIERTVVIKTCKGSYEELKIFRQRWFRGPQLAPMACLNELQDVFNFRNIRCTFIFLTMRAMESVLEMMEKEVWTQMLVSRFYDLSLMVYFYVEKGILIWILPSQCQLKELFWKNPFMQSKED